MFENGPCNIRANGTKTELNPFSWNEEANMLYLDSPVGVGGSWADKSTVNSASSSCHASSVALLCPWRPCSALRWHFRSLLTPLSSFFPSTRHAPNGRGRVRFPRSASPVSSSFHPPLPLHPLDEPASEPLNYLYIADTCPRYSRLSSSSPNSRSTPKTTSTSRASRTLVHTCLTSPRSFIASRLLSRSSATPRHCPAWPSRVFSLAMA